MIFLGIVILIFIFIGVCGICAIDDKLEQILGKMGMGEEQE